MAGKRTVWTREKSLKAKKICEEEVALRGTKGYLRRSAIRLDVPYKSLTRHLENENWKPAVEEGELPADHPVIRNLERRLAASEVKVRDLRSKLKTTDRQGGVIDELVTVAEANIEPIARVDLKLSKKGPGQEDVDAFVTLSDQHDDRVIREEGIWGLERYDFNVFCARLWEWAKTIKRYTTVHLPNYKFDTLWVGHLGDAVNGDIHNMKLKNQWGNSLKAALAIGDAQAQALLWLADAFERIAVVCVSGNHGRTTNQIEWEDPHDNFDYLVAKAMQLRLAEHQDRIQIFTPRSWSAHVDIRGHLFHLNHGHGVKGSMGIPWYGFERREGRVQRLLSFKDQQAEYFAYGHYHTPMTRPAGKGKAIHSGAWYFTDEYCQNALAVGNEPEQTLMMISERFGRQMEIPIMIRDREMEAKLHRGEWVSPFGRHLVIDEPETRGDALPIIR